MPNRPLLLFPAPERADRGKLPPGFGRTHWSLIDIECCPFLSPFSA